MEEIRAAIGDHPDDFEQRLSEEELTPWRASWPRTRALYVGDERIEATAGQFALGPRDVPHRFEVGPAGARMLWVCTPAGFENLVEAVSVPAEAMTVPPPEVVPPENAGEIVASYGNEILG